MTWETAAGMRSQLILSKLDDAHMWQQAPYNFSFMNGKLL